MQLHPSDDRLAESFDALSHPARIGLLRTLAQPRTLSEISVKVATPTGDPGRPLARQTIREHMEPLLRVGLVVARETRRERGPTVEYVVSQPALYGLAEEARDLARVRPLVEAGAQTRDEAARPPSPILRPGLLVVKGLYEGTGFDLSPGRSGKREWYLGRSRRADVTLDYDPYVSSLNSRIAFEGAAYHIETLPDSKNGTFLNHRLLEVGRPAPLRHGDVVIVGRTTLVFWE